MITTFKISAENRKLYDAVLQLYSQFYELFKVG